MRLHVIVEQDEDGYFVAEVPALPDCLSQGKTREEALTNIREAIEGWFEVMESKHSPGPDREETNRERSRISKRPSPRGFGPKIRRLSQVFPGVRDRIL